MFADSSDTAGGHDPVCSDQPLVREVALAEPHGGFPLVDQLRRDLPRSLSHFRKMSQQGLAKLQHFSPVRTTSEAIDG